MLDRLLHRATIADIDHWRPRTSRRRHRTQHLGHDGSRQIKLTGESLPVTASLTVRTGRGGVHDPNEGAVCRPVDSDCNRGRSLRMRSKAYSSNIHVNLRVASRTALREESSGLRAV